MDAFADIFRVLSCPPKRTKKKCPEIPGHALTIFQVKFQNFHYTISCGILWSLQIQTFVYIVFQQSSTGYCTAQVLICPEQYSARTYLNNPSVALREANRKKYGHVRGYLYNQLYFVIFRNINTFSVISKSSLFGCLWCPVRPGVTCSQS